MSKKTVVIAGAGLSGLTLGTALALRGWDVQILERSAELREIGAGLYTWENGLRVLEAIGVYDEACKQVEFITQLDMIDENQELIHSTPFSNGNRFCIIPRKDVHSALVRAAQKAGVQLETSARAVCVDPSGSISLENGKTIKADLVIGADGVYSNVRNALNIEHTVEKMNNGALRAMIPRIETDKKGLAMEHWSGYRRIGISPSTAEYMYVYLTASSDDEEGLSDPMNKDAWLASFPHLESVINRITQTRLDCYFYYIYLKSWSKGRVALLGDAAHGMEPNLGQGAGVSITSALELAKQLDKFDIATALKSWETVMRPTVEQTQLWSRIYGAAAAQWPKELLGVRSEVIRKTLGSEQVDLMMSTAARHITGSVFEIGENVTAKQPKYTWIP
ncbi:monooxygenase [Brevibacillus reuszeri]|uniref:FAD-dependent oxidoreductase n=1 Tax=Brevibacillus reuszeri TaxID=54915 RepID=UPI001AFE4CDA|nr:NAD(P)/FAD-dependent oxidoreductase [Brevibacillus reuszeri]GIO04801.1 monooxygenase [Brevibacillus reuszeri]